MTKNPSTQVAGVETLVKRCKDGAVLQKTFLFYERSGRTEVVYSLDSGDTVRERDALEAIRRGRLEPQRDGLFGDCQTWSYAASRRRKSAGVRR